MTRRFRQLDGVSPLGVGVVVALLATGGYALYQFRPLFRAPDAAVVDASKRRDAEKAVRSFTDATSRHVAQIDGRSLFYLPTPPELTEDSGPKPTVYGGPTLYAYVNSTAYFTDGQKLSPSAPEDRTLKLVKANPPWSVRVLWEGGEFDVELFKRTDLSALHDAAKSSTAPLPMSSGAARPNGSSRSARLQPPTGRPAAPANVNPIPPGPGAETKPETAKADPTTAKEATPAPQATPSPQTAPAGDPSSTPTSTPPAQPASPPPTSPTPAPVQPAPAEPAPPPPEPAPNSPE